LEPVIPLAPANLAESAHLSSSPTGGPADTKNVPRLDCATVGGRVMPVWRDGDVLEHGTRGITSLVKGTGGEMKIGKVLAALTVYVAVMGVCLPQSLLAAPPAGRVPTIVDVALRDNNVLLGQVVDTAGLPKSHVPVAILTGEEPLAVGKTDDQGFFAFRGLQGGVYQIAAARGCGAYRLWSPGTAPPMARGGALVVAGQDLVRGNYCGDPCSEAVGWAGFCLCSKPLVVGALVATAVAVPVAIHASNRGEPASPADHHHHR
jgi:hypothetical protein